MLSWRYSRNFEEERFGRKLPPNSPRFKSFSKLVLENTQKTVRERNAEDELMTSHPELQNRKFDYART